MGKMGFRTCTYEELSNQSNCYFRTCQSYLYKEPNRVVNEG